MKLKYEIDQPSYSFIDIYNNENLPYGDNLLLEVCDRVDYMQNPWNQDIWESIPLNPSMQAISGRNPSYPEYDNYEYYCEFSSGKSYQFRILFISDGSVEFSGLEIDDIAFECMTQ